MQFDMILAIGQNLRSRRHKKAQNSKGNRYPATWRGSNMIYGEVLELLVYKGRTGIEPCSLRIQNTQCFHVD